MTATWPWVSLLITCASALTYTHTRLLVPRIAEPDDGAELGKRSYVSLGTTRELVALGVLLVVAQLMGALAPQSLWPIWMVAGSSMLVLVWVDALTTWLPTPLLALVSTELFAAIVLSCWLSDSPTQLLARMSVGAVGSAALFAIVWLVSRGGFGFGDVRLAPLIGAVAASTSLTHWYVSLLAGSLVGVVLALIPHKVAPGTKNGFAYAPSMLAGPYLACIWLAVVG
ncbi:MAG: prepilin peptidase [Propionibacteriaceae bacterium]|jgi:leader peptidase (prepilin peptidase)/N-methyltransferase|nr:prepilin peptidase [Propionibacteriaceae bacterium]